MELMSLEKLNISVFYLKTSWEKVKSFGKLGKNSFLQHSKCPPDPQSWGYKIKSPAFHLCLSIFVSFHLFLFLFHNSALNQRSSTMLSQQPCEIRAALEEQGHTVIQVMGKSSGSLSGLKNLWGKNFTWHCLPAHCDHPTICRLGNLGSKDWSEYAKVITSFNTYLNVY